MRGAPPAEPPTGPRFFESELDPPPGWTRTSEDSGTRFTSPDEKARIWFGVTDGRSAIPTRYAAMNRFCAGETAASPEEHRKIGPDRLPAYYYETTCEGTDGPVTMVAVDVLLALQAYEPEVSSTADARDPSRLVLVSSLAKDCPEARRLELATVIASIRRKR
jgi:hypothetical protein